MAETILVVDNDSVVLDYVDVVLRLNGYGVLRAESAEKALEICAGNRAKVSLLLTDIQMPEMTRRALSKSVADKYPGVRIIFMTGNTADSESSDALTSEPCLDGHLLMRKPFSPETLIKNVKRLLGDPSGRRPATGGESSG